MGMLKKAVHLFRESARERWGFTVFSVVLFFVVSCIEYLIYVGMIYAVFWALGTKSVEGMAAVALVCAAVAILYLGLCYYQNVYVDMNTFQISAAAERRAMQRLHLFDSKAAPEGSGEEILSIVRQGSSALAIYFSTYSRILAGMAVLAALVAYGLGSSVYILILLGVTIAMTAAGLWLSGRIMRQTEESRQDALSACERSAGFAAQGIYLRCFGPDAAAREYGQYRQDRAQAWTILWRQEKGIGFVRSFQEAAGAVLKGGLGRMCYPDYENGRMSYDEIATALNSYDRLRQTISRQVYPYQQAARTGVAISRLEGWYQPPVSREGSACGEIEAKDVCFWAEGRQILKKVSFRLQAGEHVALVGENGSGKTTLLRCLLGLLSFQEGEVLYDGQAWNGLSYGQRRACFSWIPNQACLFEGSADYNMEMNRGEGEDADKTALCEAFALHKGADENVLHFSDGEQQRVNILRGLCHKAAWIIADEPTARLQRALSRQAMERLLESAQTCLVITHEREHLELFDRLLVLRNGELVYDGAPGGYEA